MQGVGSYNMGNLVQMLSKMVEIGQTDFEGLVDLERLQLFEMCVTLKIHGSFEQLRYEEYAGDVFKNGKNRACCLRITP